MSAASIKEAESVLLTFPGLTSVTVVAQGMASGELCLVAYVTPVDPSLDLPALHAHARRLLPGPLTPAAIVVLDELPVTTDGTIDLSALPEPDPASLVPYRPPVTARQEVLCALFAEILGVVRCGLDSDFFSLGGRSVDATLLAARISSELGIRMSMADLFRAPSPGDLDCRISAKQEAAK
jgi:hypothetical protein